MGVEGGVEHGLGLHEEAWLRRDVAALRDGEAAHRLGSGHVLRPGEAGLPAERCSHLEAEMAVTLPETRVFGAETCLSGPMRQCSGAERQLSGRLPCLSATSCHFPARASDGNAMPRVSGSTQTHAAVATASTSGTVSPPVSPASATAQPTSTGATTWTARARL